MQFYVELAVFMKREYAGYIRIQATAVWSTCTSFDFVFYSFLSVNGVLIIELGNIVARQYFYYTGIKISI
jgi:hypothetical protein